MTRVKLSSKVKKAKTDPMTMPTDDNNLSERPEAENLLGIYSSLEKQSIEKTIKEFGGKKFFLKFKEKLSSLIIEKN